MHFHEIEHFIGVITEIKFDEKIEIGGIDYFPVQIIDGNSLRSNDNSLTFNPNQKTFYIFGSEIPSLENYNKLLDFRIYTAQFEEKDIKIIDPISTYLREGDNYSVIILSKGDFGCIPMASARALTQSVCLTDDEGKKYVKFDNAGLKNKRNGKEFPATLLVEDDDGKVCDLVKKCIEKGKTIKGAINGKRRWYWPFNVVKAHIQRKVTINGKEKNYWVIAAKRIKFSCE